MGKNTKPMLTALMDGDKLQQLRDYASKRDVSMGWLINRLVDRLLAGDIDVMGETSSIAQSRDPLEKVSRGSSGKSIEILSEASIGHSILNRDSIEESYTGLARESIEEMIKTSIGIERERVEELIKGYIGIEKKTYIGLAEKVNKWHLIRSINDRSN